MSTTLHDRPLELSVGRLFVTPGVIAQIKPAEVFAALERHRRGDWGLVCEEDQLANEAALIHELRILSSYEDKKGQTFWIITEADRSATTILLPEEY